MVKLEKESRGAIYIKGVVALKPLSPFEKKKKHLLSKKNFEKVWWNKKKAIPLQPLYESILLNARPDGCKGFASLAQLVRARDL